MTRKASAEQHGCCGCIYAKERKAEILFVFRHKCIADITLLTTAVKKKTIAVSGEGGIY